MGTDLVSFVITVTAEEGGKPILTAQVNPFRANGGAVGGYDDMYAHGLPVPLTLCCDREDARRDDKDPNSSNMWKIAATNMDPKNGSIFQTIVLVDIVTDHNVKIVIVPAPKPIF